MSELRNREDPGNSPRASGRSHLRGGLLASLALLLAGVAAFAFMGPQFALFIPILAGAWLLARFGLVPRGLHSRGESVRLAGGPTAGTLVFAEVTITTDSSSPAAALALTRELIASANATIGAPAGGSDESVVAWEGDAMPLDSCASPDAESWTTRWPRLVRRQAECRARIAFELVTETGSHAIVRTCWIGEREILAGLLIRFARSLRDRHGVEAWTTGWLREAERAALPVKTARRKRA